MSKNHKPLSKEEFFERYGDKINKNSRFTTKAYYDVEETVSIFPEEHDVDMYFQLPEYKTKLVPDESRYIYVFPAGSIKEKNYAKLDERRTKIPVSDLKFFADPYSPQDSKKEPEEKIEITDKSRAVMISVFREMIDEYEEKHFGNKSR